MWNSFNALFVRRKRRLLCRMLTRRKSTVCNHNVLHVVMRGVMREQPSSALSRHQMCRPYTEQLSLKELSPGEGQGLFHDRNLRKDRFRDGNLSVAYFSKFIISRPKTLPGLLKSTAKTFFLEEVRRLEENLRAGLRDARDYAANSEVAAATVGDGLAAGPSTLRLKPMTEAEVRDHLEHHKESVRLEAMASVLRHREHLKALQQEKAWLK